MTKCHTNSVATESQYNWIREEYIYWALLVSGIISPKTELAFFLSVSLSLLSSWNEPWTLRKSEISNSGISTELGELQEEDKWFYQKQEML